jgi:hypothetical protein
LSPKPTPCVEFAISIRCIRRRIEKEGQQEGKAFHVLLYILKHMAEPPKGVPERVLFVSKP